MTQRRVVVTGLGAVGPLGIGLQTTFDALLQGRSGISRLQAFEPAGFDAQIAGQVAELKIRDFVPKASKWAFLGDYISEVKWQYEIGSCQKTNLSEKYISRCYLAFGGKQQLFCSQRTRPLFPTKNRATIVLPNRLRG